jgi:hypothetical protein
MEFTSMYVPCKKYASHGWKLANVTNVPDINYVGERVKDFVKSLWKDAKKMVLNTIYIFSVTSFLDTSLLFFYSIVLPSLSLFSFTTKFILFQFFLILFATHSLSLSFVLSLSLSRSLSLSHTHSLSLPISLLRICKQSTSNVAFTFFQ